MVPEKNKTKAKQTNKIHHTLELHLGSTILQNAITDLSSP
jgi:hypothetical protein